MLFEFFLLLTLVACTIALLVIGIKNRRGSWAYSFLAAFCAIVLFCFAALILILPGGHRPDRTGACISNLSNLSKALLIYEGDFDGKTPRADRVKSLQGYYAELKCPVYERPICYAINRSVIDVDSDLVLNPAQTVTLFDAITVGGTVAGQGEIDWRHIDERAVFSFVDGHCRPFSEIRATKLSC